MVGEPDMMPTAGKREPARANEGSDGHPSDPDSSTSSSELSGSSLEVAGSDVDAT